MNGTYNVPGNQDANGVFALGTNVFLVRDKGGSDEFFVINALVPALPTLTSSLDLSDAAYDIVVSGSYAYLASANNSGEVQAINISNLAAPSLAGSVDIASNTDATTVALYGDKIFIGQGTNVCSISITVPTAPSQITCVGVSGTVQEVLVTDGYLFVGTNSNSSEFQVLAVDSGGIMSVIATVDVSGNTNVGGLAYIDGEEFLFGVSEQNSGEVLVFQAT